MGMLASSLREKLRLLFFFLYHVTPGYYASSIMVTKAPVAVWYKLLQTHRHRPVPEQLVYLWLLPLQTGPVLIRHPCTSLHCPGCLTLYKYADILVYLL